VRAKFLRYR